MTGERRIKGRKQVRISKGIKEVPADYFRTSAGSHPQAFRIIPLENPTTGSMGTPITWSAKPTLLPVPLLPPPFCGWILMGAPEYRDERAGPVIRVLLEKWTRKKLQTRAVAPPSGRHKRFPAVSLVSYKSKKRCKILRILPPQEGTGELSRSTLKS